MRFGRRPVRVEAGVGVLAALTLVASLVFSSTAFAEDGEVLAPTRIRVEPRTTTVGIGEAATLTVWAGDDDAQTEDVTDQASFEFVGGAGTCEANVCRSQRAGQFVVKVSYEGLVDTAGLEVLPGEPHSLSIVPARVSVLPGETRQVQLVWRDEQGNVVRPVTESVSLDHAADLGCALSSGTLRCSSSTPGSYPITATLSSDPSVSAEAEFVVEDTTGAVTGLRVELDQESVEAGTGFDVRAVGRDAAGDPIDVTAQTTFRILHSSYSDLTEDVGSCTAARCTIEKVGAYDILAIYRAARANERILVQAADPVELVFDPSELHAQVGEIAATSPWFVDRFGNRTRPTEVQQPELVLTAQAPAQCFMVLCGAEAPGRYPIEATYRQLRAQGTLWVHPEPSVAPEQVARIRVNQVDPPTTAGEPGRFVVRGFDADDQPLGKLSDGVTLAIDGAGTWQTPGVRHERSCEADTCTSTLAGDFRVTASYAALSASTTMQVVAGESVRNGIAPANAVVRAGERQTFVFGSVDQYGNLAGRTSGFVGARMRASAGATCEGYVCWSDTPGTYVIGVDVRDYLGELAGDSWSMNALLTVIPADVDHIEVTASPTRVAAGEVIGLTATAYDDQDRVIGDVTDETEFRSMGPMACGMAICTSLVAADYEITGILGELSDAVTVTVTPADAAYDTLTPATATVRPGEPVDYVVTRFDEYDNQVSTPTSDYAFSAGEDATCDGASCVSRKPGTHQVTATASGQPDLSAEFTVEVPQEAYLVMLPETGTAVAGERVDFRAMLHAASGDLVGDVTAETTFVPNTGAADCLAAACGSTAAGDYTVTGAYGELTDDAQLRVTAAGVDRIEVTPDGATIDAGATQQFGTVGYDAYDNPVGDLTEATSFAISGAGRCEANACGAEQGGDYRVTAAYQVPVLERATAAAAPGDRLTAEVSLTVRAGDAEGPGAEGPDTEEPDTDADGAAPGSETTSGLPSTGAPLGRWHLFAALLLVLAGLVGMRRRI